VIQTEFMRDMMRKHGAKIVCMDSTHGTNLYQFLLISILVIDEHGEGLPVAWAISNKEDTNVLTEYLSAVKERTENVTPKIFMSDDAEAFYNAWKNVFGSSEETKRILCLFHIDRAWRKKLKELIKDKQEVGEVYHQLRALLTEREKGKFHVLLQQFASLMKVKHPSFFTYFSNTYAHRAPIWATCYRVGTIANTNRHLEAFHRKLKVVYLNNKQNRRLGSLLHILLKIAHDTIFEAFRKCEVGKVTHRKCEINRRHSKAEKIDTALLQTSSQVGERMASEIQH